MSSPPNAAVERVGDASNGGFADAPPDLVGQQEMTRESWKVLLFCFLAFVLDASDGTIYSLTLSSIREEFGLSLTTMGFLASVFLAGTVLGSLFLPVLADRKGRRFGIAVCVAIFSVFTGGIALAGTVTAIAVARFFTGVGVGAEWPIGAAYLSEMVPAARRGFAMGLMQSGYPVGFFLAASIVASATWLQLDWRASYLVLIVPALLCIPILTMLKESPTWVRTQRDRLSRGGPTRPAARPAGFATLFRRENLRTTLIATGLHVFGAIFSYGFVVWLPSAITIDFHVDRAHTAQFIMFALGVGTLGYLASGPLADRYGRKIILTAYTLLGVAAVLVLNYLLSVPGIGFGQLLVPGTMIGFSLGVTTIYITYTSEIYPDHLRTIGLGFSVAVGKLTAVFVPTILGAAAEMSSITLSLGLSTLIGLLMVPVICCGPETAQRPLNRKRQAAQRPASAPDPIG